MSVASSGVALGMTPGSLKLVRNSVDKTKITSKAATTGMAGDTLTARYGQLKSKVSVVLNVTVLHYQITRCDFN